MDQDVVDDFDECGLCLVSGMIDRLTEGGNSYVMTLVKVETMRDNNVKL